MDQMYCQLCAPSTTNKKKKKKRRKNPNKSCNFFTSSMFRVHIYIFFIGKCTGKIYIKKRKWRPKANPKYTRSIQEAPKGKNKKEEGIQKISPTLI